MIEKEDKKEIIQEVIKELKRKKLFGITKSSFNSTEKMLFSFSVLPDAIEMIKTEIKKLEKENKKIPKISTKSKTLVLREEHSTYVYGDETLETRISELKQIVELTNSQIRIVTKSLKRISREKYFDIIPKYYFENKTIPQIAEEMNCSIGTISENKKKLMDKLKIYMFPEKFIKEL
jgi:RNA polymerase sigma factor (sigma-70 family)